MENLTNEAKKEDTSVKGMNAKIPKTKVASSKQTRGSKISNDKSKQTKSKKTTGTNNLAYPKHSISKILRIPKAIIEQNAGKDCTTKEAASYVGVGHNGPFIVEISSAKKYGLIESTGTSRIQPTDLAKRIIRPQSPEDELAGLRIAVTNAPTIGDVYTHYRGENLPDNKFFENALTDLFKISTDKVSEFISVFTESLTTAKLLEKVGEKVRVLDISSNSIKSLSDSSSEIKKLGKGMNITSNDTCFVMMPFSPPLGDYYSQIFEPAITKAGLSAMRADNDIFGTGKIIDQIWNGINNSKVLIAELSQRNPNVYYELGIAHALKKPVVLVCSNEEDVPFDLKHIRVIYYNMYDPFWGNKLIEKIAENILSAIRHPEETILFK